ncbi:MAG: glycosyltransferase [Lachnospiraceae bacterium]|nr:glycosyltransferase [Lachnospiraceae bacterium]
MMETKFSVSICVYDGNRAEEFNAAMLSIIDQTRIPTEIVLVVDGPINNGLEAVVEETKGKAEEHGIEFKTIRLEKNLGHGEARRRGLEACEHPFVAIMDADDLSVHDRFEKQLKFLEKNPDVAVVGGYITEFVSSTNPTDISNSAGKRIVPLEDADIKQYMKKRCPMNQVTVVLKKADVEECGGYIDWYCEEDYYLWIRMAIAGKKFGNIPETLVNVRVGKEMYRRRGGWKYFRSEAKLQRLMLSNGIITLVRYVVNLFERFAIQVMMPAAVRSVVFSILARK